MLAKARQSKHTTGKGWEWLWGKSTDKTSYFLCRETGRERRRGGGGREGELGVS